MIYITGDIHGDPIARFSYKCHPELKNLTENDYIIVLGDCGVPFYNPELKFYDMWTKPGAEKSEHYKLAWLNSRPWKTLFLRGNHDNIDLIYEMPHTIIGHADVRQMCYQDKIYENIFYIDTPQFMYLQGYKIFFVPGAESHDVDYLFEYDDPNIKTYLRAINRQFQKTGEVVYYRINHFSWWENEGVDKEKTTKMVNKTPCEVDFIFTHAPRGAIHNYWKFPNHPAREHPAPSEQILEDEVAARIKYKMWVHGHFHYHIELPMIYSLGIYYDIYSIDELQQKKKAYDLENKYHQELLEAMR